MEFLGGIFAIITIVLPFVAIVGLIKPSFLKQKNRKQVLLRFLLPVPIFFVLAGMLLPTVDNADSKQIEKNNIVNTDTQKEAAELKAKQEQEAKEAAKLKAKQEQKAKEAAELKAKQEQEAKEADEKKWYVGGTLHKENALAWQGATDQNKLATCGDIVSTMWAEKVLKKEIMAKIKSVDDLKPLAEALVKNLDEAFKKDRDEKKNKAMFTNQEVSKTALLLAIQMGWLKLPK